MGVRMHGQPMNDFDPIQFAPYGYSSVRMSIENAAKEPSGKASIIAYLEMRGILTTHMRRSHRFLPRSPQNYHAPRNGVLCPHVFIRCRTKGR